MPLSLGGLAAFNESMRRPAFMYGARVPASRGRLVWCDEFSHGRRPDPSKWSYDVGGSGWGNEEEQYYTRNRRENARMENGKLVIEARRERHRGCAYTSARLVSKNRGDWRYGRFEARALIPDGRGTWPAIWMLPTDSRFGVWPRSGEIDIMEHVGYDPHRIHGTVHTLAYHHKIGTQKGGSTVIPTPSWMYHLYGVDWSQERIDFHIDHVIYHSFKNEGTGYAAWPFDERFHFVLNIAVGGFWGGAKGIDENVFPQKMLIDYVRVYQ
jgi:beta-glucanase (GH16 family)